MQDEASHTTKVVNKESNLQKINVERKVNFYVTIGDSHQLISCDVIHRPDGSADQPDLQIFRQLSCYARPALLTDSTATWWFSYDYPLYWLVTVKLNQQVAVLSVGEPDIHQVDNVMTNPYLLKLLILF